MKLIVVTTFALYSVHLTIREVPGVQTATLIHRRLLHTGKYLVPRTLFQGFAARL